MIGRWQKISPRLNVMLLLLSTTCRSSASFLLIFIISFFLLVAVSDGSDLQDDSAMNELLSMLDSASALEKRKQQDQRFQQAAFQAFDHHKTGEIYNVSSFPGSVVQAVRLRSGSLRKYGLTFNEFEIVHGCQVQSSAERVFLVYENLGRSDLFAVHGYVLVGPVVGISVYDASDLTTTQPVPKLTVNASRENISVHLRFFQPLVNVTPLCAHFKDNSQTVDITNPSSTGICYVSRLGFFSLVAQSFAPAPATAPSRSFFPPAPSVTIPSTMGKTSRHRKRSKTWKIVVGSVVGALALLALLSIVAFAAVKYRRHQRFTMMEYQADLGETLQTALIRNTRAPAAGGTRTQPILESEYVS